MQKLKNNFASANIILLTASNYTHIPLLLLAFERHLLDLLGKFISLISGMTDILTLINQTDHSEMHMMWGQKHVIVPNLKTICPVKEGETNNGMFSVELLHTAAKSILNEDDNENENEYHERERKRERERKLKRKRTCHERKRIS